MSKETRDSQAAELEHLRNAVTGLQRHLKEEGKESGRLRRALAAGARRYRREQHRNRHVLESVLQQANHRAEQLELAGQEQALLHLQAVAENHQLRKQLAAAERRGAKLAAKLVYRAGELGKERRSWAGAAAGRERALEEASKRTGGLRASLRQSKARARAALRRAELAERQVIDLRQKLRDANSSVIMEALGGGLEIRPVSGLQHENTAGYGPAALRAVKGWQQ